MQIDKNQQLGNSLNDFSAAEGLDPAQKKLTGKLPSLLWFIGLYLVSLVGFALTVFLLKLLIPH